jgi:hypothetical protein
MDLTGQAEPRLMRLATETNSLEVAIGNAPPLIPMI